MNYIFILGLGLCCIQLFCDAKKAGRKKWSDKADSGYAMYRKAGEHLRKGAYQKSKQLYREALVRDDLVGRIDINTAVDQMLEDHRDAGVPWAGYTLVAEVMRTAGNKDDARQLVELALQENPSYPDAAVLKAELVDHDVDLYKLIMQMQPDLQNAIRNGYDDPEILSRAAAMYSNCLIWDTAEFLYARSFLLDSSKDNLKSFASGVFMRNHICKWGENGALYDEDMQRVSDIIREEVKTTFRGEGIKQASAFTPANVLGYPISPALKLAVAQAFSRAEQAMVVSTTRIQPLNHSKMDIIRRVKKDSQQAGFRIRVGYVSANIKSRTTTFMGQNVLLSHDKSKFEVHVYATTPADSHDLLYNRMRGVDWRSKIRNGVEHFHETHTMDTGQLFRLIRQHDIHILINWDGYSNAGIRAAGIFALSPAPIQINHQEYIGTMGADYIQYFISDAVSSPEEYRKYYSEKLILMPHAFLATSMAYLGPDMTPPSRETPAPEKNGCHGDAATFVYCNMNKHMKFSPEVFKHWMHILQAVPGSVLCLLQNPPQAEPNLREFIREIDDSLQDRVRYSQFIVNPYDNQLRVKEQCNVVLDTPIYSGHTTNADALWAGVPIVTHGTSVDISGRVGHSMLTAVGLPELIAESQEHYDDIAIEFGLNRSYYIEKRDKLVDTCLATDPPHPYWDLQRYTQGLERGFEMIFDRYIDGKSPTHVEIIEQFDGNVGSRSPSVMYPSSYSASYLESESDMLNNLDTIERLLLEEEGIISTSGKDPSRAPEDDETDQASSPVRRKRRRKSRRRKEDHPTDTFGEETGSLSGRRGVDTKASAAAPISSEDSDAHRSGPSLENDDTSARKKRKRKKSRRQKPEL